MQRYITLTVEELLALVTERNPRHAALLAADPQVRSPMLHVDHPHLDIAFAETGRIRGSFETYPAEYHGSGPPERTQTPNHLLD